MDELKAVIRSILTSTTSTMSIQQLSKDYKNTIGGPVPYQKFGFNSLEHMMKSIPDVVVVRGSGPFAELIVVQSDKSAHIDHLVSKQKAAVKKKQDWCYNQRRNVSHLTHSNKPSSGQTYKNTQYPSKQVPSLMSSVIHPPQILMKDSSQSNKTMSPIIITQQSETISVPKKSDQTLYKPQISRQTSSQTRQNSLTLSELNHSHSNNSSSKVQKFELNKENLQKFQQQLKSSEVDISNSTNVTRFKPENKYKVKDDFKPPIESAERHIPYTVKYNLKTLIEKYPQGIWCTEVPAVYKKLFRSELRYAEIGFRSLIELCSSLPSIFHYVRPSTEDFKLYYRNRPLPEDAEKSFTLASYQPEPKIQEKTEALPTFDWKDFEYLLPSNVVALGEEIPREFVSETTEVNHEIDIGRGEVYDLSKFWVYINNGALDELMQNLQNFYKDNAQEYHIPKNIITEGLYCVLIFDEDYHRALIVNVIDEESVKVVFIDYGTTSNVSSSGLYFLHKSFEYLPAQAIRCRLANIQPVVGGGTWPNEALCRFRDLFSSYRTFTAKIMRIDRKHMALDIYLWDNANSLDNLYVNDRLVKEGFAIYSDQVPQKMLNLKNCRVKHLHLFPTFEELECGLSLSTSETEAMECCGLPLNFICPQYFDHEFHKEFKCIQEIEDSFAQHCLESKFKKSGFGKHAESLPFNYDIFSKLKDGIKIYGSGEICEINNGNKNLILNSNKDEEMTNSKYVIHVMDELAKDCLEIFKDISAFSQMKLEGRYEGSDGSSTCENLEELRDELGSITEDVVNLAGLTLDDTDPPSEVYSTRTVEQNLEEIDQSICNEQLCSTNPFIEDLWSDSTDSPLVLELNKCNPFLHDTEGHDSESAINNVLTDTERSNSVSTYFSEDNFSQYSASVAASERNSDSINGVYRNGPYCQSGSVQFTPQTSYLPAYCPQDIYPYVYQYLQYAYSSFNSHIQHSQEFYGQRQSSVPIPPGFSADTIYRGNNRSVGTMEPSIHSTLQLNTNVPSQGDFYERYNKYLSDQRGRKNNS